jgi:hypothetical protein
MSEVILLIQEVKIPLVYTRGVLVFGPTIVSFTRKSINNFTFS